MNSLWLKLHDWYYRHFADLTKPHSLRGLGGDMVRIRSVQAIATGHKDVVVTPAASEAGFHGLPGMKNRRRGPCFLAPLVLIPLTGLCRVYVPPVAYEPDKYCDRVHMSLPPETPPAAWVPVEAVRQIEAANRACGTYTIETLRTNTAAAENNRPDSSFLNGSEPGRSGLFSASC